LIITVIYQTFISVTSLFNNFLTSNI